MSASSWLFGRPRIVWPDRSIRSGCPAGTAKSVGSARSVGSVGSVRSDRGSATVWAGGAIAALCAVFGAVLMLGQAVVIRHQAAAAADLAALAAADHWMQGSAGACATARRVVKAQGGRLVRCEVEGEISDVTAVSDLGPLTAEARARAGPPVAPGSPNSPVPPIIPSAPPAPPAPRASE